MASLKSNIAYRMLYLFISNGLGLVLAPYLARALGAESLGIFSYTGSIINYFVLFAMLGLQGYGVRSIAQVAHDYEERSKRFCSIFLFQVVTCIITTVIYITYLTYFCHENRMIFIIQGVLLLSCFLDINWFYFGIENIKFISVREMFIRVLTVVCIFLFVKTPNDLWIYTLIMGGSTFFNNIVLWILIPKLVKFKRCSFSDVLYHLKPNLTLFLPLAAMSVYHTMDKTLLGLMSNFDESGYYYNADKVIGIPIAVLLSVNEVMRPRISALVGKKDEENANKLFLKSFEITFFFSVAMAFGVAAIAKEFIPLFLGDGYQPCVLLLMMFSPLIVIKAVGYAMRYQFLIPYTLDAIYARTVIIGAVVNFVANIILIPHLAALGAVIGTIIAEFVVAALQMKEVSYRVNFKYLLKPIFTYIAIGALMFLSVRSLAIFLPSGWFSLLIEIMVGAIVFILISSIYFIIFGDKKVFTLISNLYGSLNRRKR